MKCNVLIGLIFFVFVSYNSGTSQSLSNTGFSSFRSDRWFDVIRVVSDSEIYAPGFVKDSVAGDYAYVAKWNGIIWQQLGTKIFNDRIRDIAVVSSNEIYVCGAFHNDSDKTYLAKWNGSDWSEVGILNTVDAVKHIRAFSSSDIFIDVYGWDGLSQSQVFRWDGDNWNKLGNIGEYRYDHFYVTDSKEVYVAGGYFFTGNNTVPFILNWDGKNWNEMGKFKRDIKYSGKAGPMVFKNNNEIYTAISHCVEKTKTYSSKIYMWENGKWIPKISEDNDMVGSYIRCDKKGGFYANANWNIQKWDGKSWQVIRGSEVDDYIFSFEILPNGNIYYTGAFTDTKGKYYIKRVHSK